MSGAVLTGAFAGQTANSPAQIAARLVRFALPAAASLWIAFNVSASDQPCTPAPGADLDQALIQLGAITPHGPQWLLGAWSTAIFAIPSTTTDPTRHA